MAKVYQIEFPPNPNENWIRAWDPINKCVKWVRPEDYFGEIEVDVDMDEILNASSCVADDGQPLTTLTQVLNFLCAKIDELEGATGTGYAVLRMEKVANRYAVSVGDTVEFTINVYNSGTVAASGFVLEDTLPTLLTLLSTMPPGYGDVSSNKVTWPVPSIPVGQYVSLKITARAASGGTAINMGAVTQGSVPNTGDTTFQAAAIAISSVAAPTTVNVRLVDFYQSASSAVVGGTISYGLVVENTLSTEATGVTVEVAVDGDVTGAVFVATTPGLSYNATTKKISINIGTMAGGAERTLQWSFQYLIEATVMQTAAVSTEKQNLAGVQVWTLTTNVIGITVDVQLSHTHSASKDEIEYGLPVTYFVSVAVPSSATSVTDVRVETLLNQIVLGTLGTNDVFNGGSETLSPSKGSASRISKTVVWTIPSIAAGATEVLSFTVTYNNTSVATKTTTATLTLKDSTLEIVRSTSLLCTSGEADVDLTLFVVPEYSTATVGEPFDIIIRLGNNGGSQTTDATGVTVQMIFDTADGFTNVENHLSDSYISVQFDDKAGALETGAWLVNVEYPIVYQGTTSTDREFRVTVGCAVDDEYTFVANVFAVNENNVGDITASDGPRTIIGSSDTTVENLWHPGGDGNAATTVNRRLVAETIVTPATKTLWDAANMGNIAIKYDVPSCGAEIPYLKVYCTSLNGSYPGGLTLESPGQSTTDYSNRHQFVLGNGVGGDFVNVEASNVNGNLLHCTGSGIGAGLSDKQWRRVDSSVRVLNWTLNRVQAGFIFKNGARGGTFVTNIQDTDGYNVVKFDGEGSFFTSGTTRYAWPEPNNAEGLEIFNIAATGPSVYTGGPYFVVSLEDGVYDTLIRKVSLSNSVGRGLFFAKSLFGSTTPPQINYTVGPSVIGPCGAISTWYPNGYATTKAQMHRVEKVRFDEGEATNCIGSLSAKIVELRASGLLRDIQLTEFKLTDCVGDPSATAEVDKGAVFIRTQALPEMWNNEVMYYPEPDIQQVSFVRGLFTNASISFVLTNGKIGESGANGIKLDACTIRKVNPNLNSVTWGALLIFYGGTKNGVTWVGTRPVLVEGCVITGLNPTDRMVIEGSFVSGAEANSSSWVPVHYKDCVFRTGVFQFGPATTFENCTIGEAVIYWPQRGVVPSLGSSFGLSIEQGYTVSQTANASAPTWTP